MSYSLCITAVPLKWFRSADRDYIHYLYIPLYTISWSEPFLRDDRYVQTWLSDYPSVHNKQIRAIFEGRPVCTNLTNNLSLCTQSADPSHFRGTASMYKLDYQTIPLYTISKSELFSMVCAYLTIRLFLCTQSADLSHFRGTAGIYILDYQSIPLYTLSWSEPFSRDGRYVQTWLTIYPSVHNQLIRAIFEGRLVCMCILDYQTIPLYTISWSEPFSRDGLDLRPDKYLGRAGKVLPNKADSQRENNENNINIFSILF